MCDIHLVMFIIPKQESNNKQDKNDRQIPQNAAKLYKNNRLHNKITQKKRKNFHFA